VSTTVLVLIAAAALVVVALYFARSSGAEYDGWGTPVVR
jgi:hypothetical protein